MKFFVLLCLCAFTTNLLALEPTRCFQFDHSQLTIQEESSGTYRVSILEEGTEAEVLDMQLVSRARGLNENEDVFEYSGDSVEMRVIFHGRRNLNSESGTILFQRSVLKESESFSKDYERIDCF